MNCHPQDGEIPATNMHNGTKNFSKLLQNLFSVWSWANEIPIKKKIKHLAKARPPQVGTK